MVSSAPDVLVRPENKKEAGQEHGNSIYRTPGLDDGYISITIPDGPTHLNVVESEYSIELDILTFPVGGTCSTDHLVRAPSETDSRPEEVQAGLEAEPATLTKPRPDYKPPSLRWPLLVLILAFVGGVFAFLEYQVHDLPPLRYSMVHIDDPASGQVSIQPSPPSRGRLDIASSTSHDTSTRSTTWGLVRKTPDPSPEPTPAPRPQKELYPAPISPLRTHCGWGSPEWRVNYLYWTLGDNASDDLKLCSAFGLPSCNTKTARYTVLKETMPTFLTDDESWCPCSLIRYSSETEEWNVLLGSAHDLVLDSSDQGCKSAMMAVLSFNNNAVKKIEWPAVPDAKRGSVAWDEMAVEMIYTTPPSQFSISWGYPTTNANGAIVLPLVTRTAGREVMDVFGNRVQPSDSALFPDGFQSVFTAGPPAGVNSCYWKFINAPAGWGYTCTETRTSYSIIWWTLPSGPAASLTLLPTASSTLSASISSTTLSSASSKLPSVVESPTRSNHVSSVLGLESAFPPGPNCPTCHRIKDDVSQPTPTHSTGPATTHNTDINSKQELTSAPVTPGSSTTIVHNASLEPTPISAISTSAKTDSSTIRVTRAIGSNQANVGEPVATPGSITTTSPPPSSKHTRESSSPRELEELRQSHSQNTEASIEPLAKITSETRQSTGRATKTTLTATTTIFPDSKHDCKKDPKCGKPSGPILPEAQSFFYNLRSETGYLMASVLPVLLTTLFSIPIQIFIGSLNRLLPLRALSQEQGAAAEDSLSLPLNGGNGPVSPLILSVRFLRRFRDPMPLLTVLLDTLSTVLVPISSEVIRLEFSTECSHDPKFDLMIPNNRLCAFGVRKSMDMIRLTEGLLVIMAVITLTLGFLAARWKSGVATDPWSIATVASLLASTRGNELSTLLRTLPTGTRAENEKRPVKNMDTHMAEAFKGKRFRLGFFPGPANSTISDSYGLEVIAPPMKDETPIQLTVRNPPMRKAAHTNRWKFWHLLPVPKSIELCLRLMALLFILGLLILVLHYETTIGPGTAFEAFMNSQTFGVRILFTAFGTVISSYWSYYFSRK